MKVLPTITIKTIKPFCSKEMTVIGVKSSFCKGSRISHHVTRIMDPPWVIMIEMIANQAHFSM